MPSSEAQRAGNVSAKEKWLCFLLVVLPHTLLLICLQHVISLLNENTSSLNTPVVFLVLFYPAMRWSTISCSRFSHKLLWCSCCLITSSHYILCGSMQGQTQFSDYILWHTHACWCYGWLLHMPSLLLREGCVVNTGEEGTLPVPFWHTGTCLVA